MTNKEGEPASPSLTDIFNAQMEFQKSITGLQTPVDDVTWFNYHMTAMTEELGEVLRADKRWKTHRNAKFDPENKLEEIADVFITAINIALYSNYNAKDIANRIMTKIQENTEKRRA
jgi:NTP pyrophosphatase (non-canonical NTP hydrolase)